MERLFFKDMKPGDENGGGGNAFDEKPFCRFRPLVSHLPKKSIFMESVTGFPMFTLWFHICKTAVSWRGLPASLFSCSCFIFSKAASSPRQ